MTVRRIARGLVGISAVVLVLGVAFEGLAGEGTAVQVVLILVLFLVFAGVGALVASTRPPNPIGWIFLSVAVSTALTTAFRAIA